MSKLFDKLVSLYRIIDLDSNAEGDLCLDDAQKLGLIRDLLQQDSDDTGLAILVGDPSNLSVGQTVRLQCNAPRRGVGLLLKDVAHLLEAGLLHEPSRYFLLNPRCAKEDLLKPPPDIACYRHVLLLIGLLKKAAACLDEHSKELVFIQDGRFSVPVSYSTADLTGDLVAAIDKLIALFADELHRDQKLAMLATAVQEAASRVGPAQRFGELLHHLGDVTHAVTESYRLFCSNFSYEKIKSDIQDAHIEFTAKIHKTFSDIQSQLLAIPAATVIVATQMKQANGFDAQFWINTGVLMGSGIFVVLFWLLVLNQRHTLDVLEDEIERRKHAIAKDHVQICDMFEPTFNKLRDRLRMQRSIICAVLAIVLLGFVATVIVYGYLL